MSIDTEHTPTDQEQTLYDHMTNGEWDEIDQLRQDAYTADQTPPDPIPDDWLAPAQQFDEDYQNAWRHYQADHEAPEPVRETMTAVDTHQQNSAVDPDTATEFALVALAPETVTQNGEVRVHALGACFTPAAVIIFNGTQLATAFESDAALYCTINASVGGHPAGTFDLLVRQDGAETDALPFTIREADDGS